MIRPFDLTIRGRKLSMLLDIEPGRYYSDFALGHYLDNNQAPEPELIHVLFRALKAGDLAVDAGACVGFFTIIMSKLVGPTGKVIAIEPDSRNLAMLRKNLDINDCSNVEIVEQPLLHECRTTSFLQTDENGQSHVAFGGQEYIDGISCQTTTLTAILGDRCPVLLKMDIEGSEVDAIHGLKDFNYRIPYIVSEVNPEALRRADSSPDELRELMESFGYVPFLLHESGALPSWVQPEHKLRITRPNINMLFASPMDIIQLWPEVDA